MENSNRTPWSDVPEEILTLIAFHLFGKDIIIFLRCICKSWQSVLTTIRPFPPPSVSQLSQSPCLMLPNNKFYHPIYNGIYKADDIPKSMYESGSFLFSSSHSWLLLREPLSLSIVNPFTRKKMRIPTLPIDRDGFDVSFRAVSWSSCPTSSDCTIFGISTQDIRNLVISTRKRGDENWTLHTFASKIKIFSPSCCSPIVHKNAYYFLGAKGNLAIFDPETNQYTWTIRNKYIRRKLKALSCQRFLVEVDGELVAVFVSLNGTWLRVFKFNRSRMDWDPIDCLGDTILFLSYPTSFSEAAAISGTGNKIYFAKFYKGSGIYYCLLNRKYYSQDGRYSSQDLYHTQDYSHCAWIKPDYEDSSIEPLVNNSNYASIEW